MWLEAARCPNTWSILQHHQKEPSNVLFSLSTLVWSIFICTFSVHPSHIPNVHLIHWARSSPNQQYLAYIGTCMNKNPCTSAVHAKQLGFMDVHTHNICFVICARPVIIGRDPPQNHLKCQFHWIGGKIHRKPWYFMGNAIYHGFLRVSGGDCHGFSQEKRPLY